MRNVHLQKDANPPFPSLEKTHPYWLGLASTPRIGQTHSEKAKDCHDKAQVLSATLAWFLLIAGGGEFGV